MINKAKPAHPSLDMPRDDAWAEWLDVAYRVLIEQGVEKIRISALAEQLTSTRTAFYWYFSSRDALLDELLDHWKRKNTQALIAHIESYAETINEAIFNMFDCWLDPQLFDAPLDRAVRNWANGNAKVTKLVQEADEARIAAFEALFERFDYPDYEAYTRARTIYYTQIGYVSMKVNEDGQKRILRMPAYAEIFSGHRPTASEIKRFFNRHAIELNEINLDSDERLTQLFENYELGKNFA